MDLPPGFSWSAGEATSVNQFLNSELGKKWLAILYARKPKVTLETTEKAGLSGAFAAGYESFFSEIGNTRITHTQESPSMKSIDPSKD
jgi:hypothetical protein